jgi:hypothetical protein
MPSLNQGQNPWDVISPRARWQLVDVLHESEHWSMALGRWKNDEWRPVLAQRWNGEAGGMGTPSGHGHPTWFVLPDDTYELYLTSDYVPLAKREFARNFLGIS